MYVFVAGYFKCMYVCIHMYVCMYVCIMFLCLGLLSSCPSMSHVSYKAMRALRTVGTVPEECVQNGEKPAELEVSCESGSDPMNMRPSKLVMHSWVDYVKAWLYI